MKITLVPTAGLGNRIFAIIHSISVSIDLGCDIDIYWEKTKDCHVNFTDIFKPLSRVK